MNDIEIDDAVKQERDKWLGRMEYIERLLQAYWKTPYDEHPPEIETIIEKIQKFRSKE
jgi:hypothetical protein